MLDVIQPFANCDSYNSMFTGGTMSFEEPRCLTYGQHLIYIVFINYRCAFKASFAFVFGAFLKSLD